MRDIWPGRKPNCERKIDTNKKILYNIIRKIEKEIIHMYTKADILAALQNGEDPTKLANDFAAALNDAIAEKEKEDAKAAAETDKRNRADALCELTLDFLEDYYPDIYDEEMRDQLTGELLIDAIDNAAKELNVIKDNLDALEALFADVFEAHQPEEKKTSTIYNDIEPMVHQPKKPVKKVKVKLQEGLDPIMSFLKDNGLA